MKVHIETRRLLLREWEPTDLEPFAALNADPRVMEFFPSRLSAEQTRQFYERIVGEFAECGFGLYAVQRKAEGDFVGYVGLHRIGFEADFTPGVEIGWRLAAGVWGRGYAPEAAAANISDSLRLPQSSWGMYMRFFKRSTLISCQKFASCKAVQILSEYSKRMEAGGKS